MTGLHPRLAERAEALLRDRVPFVEATVVRAEHPTSVHAGDTALVFADGTIEGFVGGTCAESSVQVHSRQVLSSGEPLLLRILPEVGETRVEPGAVMVSNPCLSGGALEIFLQPRTPPARLRVVGNTPIGQALVALAQPLGFAAEIVAGNRVEPRADDAAVIVASHGHDEEPALEAALRADVPYVALVASRRRAAEVLARLVVSAEQRDRVHSPAGLDIGARTAAEVALSILTELVSERARAGAQVAEGGIPADEPLPGTAVDPVCGMTVALTDNAITLEHEGTTYAFCCAGCRDSFAAQHGIR